MSRRPARTSLWHGPALALCLLATAAPCQRAPHIGYAYPAGGRQGTDFTVRVGGQNLRGVSGAFVSGAGVDAELVEYDPLLNQRQINALREQQRELQKRRTAAQQYRRQRRGRQGAQTAPPNLTWTDDDEKALAEIRFKIADRNRRQANPALAESAVVLVTIAPDAELGPRELRLATGAGLTNPIVFCVGQLPEFTEKEAERAVRGRGRAADRSPSVAETRIALPALVNGQIMPGDVDRFRFQARKGHRLVVAASARELMPYLPDAVPGWFQATLALYDDQGDELAFDDDYRFHPDPVLFYEIPSDGDYIVEIHDAIYRGREDFVYRIALGELPFVTSVFPLGGPAGAKTEVGLQGWNLPASRLTLQDDEEAVSPALRGEGLAANPVPFARDTLDECLEQEPNDSPETAQAIEVPRVVNGRIDRAGDTDVFSLQGRAGQILVAEVLARRLQSPVDSVLRLTDGKGQRIAFNDDSVDKGAGLTTHHADSRLWVKLPRRETYYLQLGDAQCHGGDEYGYRLRISAPRPDFELRVVPASINARAGATVPITVHAVRRDGFTGDIELSLQDAPEGFTLSGGLVPGDRDFVRLTLTVPPRPLREPVRLELQGRAKIGRQAVVHAAVPAEDMMQAFIYRHLVPARELMVAVTKSGRAVPPLRLQGNAPIRIPLGGKTRVRLTLPRRGRGAKTRVALELSEPPDGVAIVDTKATNRGLDLVVACDRKLATRGLRGNLIIQVFTAPPPATKAGARAGRRNLLGTLPAIPFEIVAR